MVKFIVINLFCQKCSIEWAIEKAVVVPSTYTDLLECPLCQSYLAEVTKPFAGLNVKDKECVEPW